jgi:hypothetical protein
MEQLIMQSAGFANFAADIIRTDWKRHAKAELSLVGVMIVIILAMLRFAPDPVFAKSVLISVGLTIPWGLGQVCFFIERAHGFLRIHPPATPFQLVLAKFGSVFSMILFIVNAPGVLIRDPVFLFHLNAAVLLMMTICMAIVVLSEQAWAAMLPLWLVFLPYLYLRSQVDALLAWGALHGTALSIAALGAIPLIVVWSALNFRMKPAAGAE